MKRFLSRPVLSAVCATLMLVPSYSVFAQEAAPQEGQDQGPPPAQMLPPQQLDNLVAPIALYPDALLSQVLVASTYPLEIAEAAQWLDQNRNLQGRDLVDAARQQNWDASIQALVAFPDVLRRLNSDIRWTTDLGNAFLAQQPDVMNAVQRMRARARDAGRLNSSPQQAVTTQTQGDQSVIEIQPTNPEVVYVPVYNPAYVWGPPVYGYYPPLFYPSIGFGFGFGFGPGIYIGGFWGGLGWGGWGWWPNWFGCSVFERPFFFSHYGYHGFVGGRFGGYGVWAHDPGHRLGVAYPNRAVASRFGGYSGRGAGASRSFNGERGMSARNSFANRGNTGATATRGGAQAGSWSHFSQNRPSVSQNRPSVSQNRPGTSQGFQHTAPTYQRPTPSYGSNYGHSTPSYHAAPNNQARPSYSSGAGNYGRPAPSYHATRSYGGGGGSRPSPAFSGRSSYSAPRGGSQAFHGGGGNAPHVSSGGGGGFHGGGGGGGHSSGGHSGRR